VFDSTAFLPSPAEMIAPAIEPPPAPEPAPSPEKPAEPAEEPKPAAPSPPSNPQEDLANFVTEAGFTFDDFREWAMQTGNITEADSLGSFDDIPPGIAKRILRAQVGLIKGLEGLKGGAK
jgi:hypothetical protein